MVTEWWKNKHETRTYVFQVELQQDRRGWWYYKLKCQKAAQITYLEANRQYILRFGSCNQGTVDILEAKTTAWNVNGAFSAVKNKQ